MTKAILLATAALSATMLATSAFAQADELIAAGHARREAFTLERSGAALAAAYRRVAAGGPA